MGEAERVTKKVSSGSGKSEIYLLYMKDDTKRALIAYPGRSIFSQASDPNPTDDGYKRLIAANL